jgi:signal transduction histidine kinase
VGSISLTLGHVISGSSIPHVWATWWLGDFCGAIIVVSLALAFTSRSTTPWLRGHVIEAGLVLVTLVVLSVIAARAARDLSFLAFPALVWAGLRFGPRGAAIAIAVGAAFTIWGATDFFGPFPHHPFAGRLLDIQLYLAITQASALAVAALASERLRLAESVRASRTRIVVAADEERRRLEHNLHDGAQQRLIALSVRLGRAARDARGKPGTAVRSLEDAQSEVLVAIEELRDLVHGVRPAVLRRFGLARAVEGVAARSATAVEIVELPEVRLDETAETTAYYVVLEAVTNAERHAQASRIRVSARFTWKGLELEIDDDGVGGATERGELGLQGLRDRVEATGGSFIVETALGQGTRIQAQIPARVVGSAGLV